MRNSLVALGRCWLAVVHASASRAPDAARSTPRARRRALRPAQFSFVNSIATTKGGTHVNHVADQVVDRVLEFLKKKHKGLEKTLKPNHVKSHLKVFVNCLVENPAFDSQTKEYMTLKQSAFGSKCTFSDKFFKDVLNCGVLESILMFAQNKQNKCARGARRDPDAAVAGAEK